MPSPTFAHSRGLPADEIKNKLADRVRFERQRLGLSQADFAERCGVALRTYKRFELKGCDSLTIFLRIVAGFDRTAGLETLFPAEPLRNDARTATAILNRLVQRLDKEGGNG